MSIPVRSLSFGRRQHSIMLLLQAYYDDSGDSNTPGESVYCIGGGISPLPAWEKLEQEWQNVLCEFQVPYLHMKEFAHSIGAYKDGWKGDEPKRKTFLSALMDIMDRHVMSVIGATVLIEDFNNLSQQQQEQMVDPHFMCLQDVFLGSTVHLHDKPEENINIVFSRQSRHIGRTEEFFRQYTEHGNWGSRLGSFSWAQAKMTPALRVADLVAYEMRTFARDLFRDGPTTMRTPMKRLFRMGPYFHFFDRNEIIKRFYFSGRPTIHMTN